VSIDSDNHQQIPFQLVQPISGKRASAGGGLSQNSKRITDEGAEQIKMIEKQNFMIPEDNPRHIKSQ
jgi:hypothetical protein